MAAVFLDSDWNTLHRVCWPIPKDNIIDAILRPEAATEFGDPHPWVHAPAGTEALAESCDLSIEIHERSPVNAERSEVEGCVEDAHRRRVFRKLALVRIPLAETGDVLDSTKAAELAAKQGLKYVDDAFAVRDFHLFELYIGREDEVTRVSLGHVGATSPRSAARRSACRRHVVPTQPKTPPSAALLDQCQVLAVSHLRNCANPRCWFLAHTAPHAVMDNPGDVCHWSDHCCGRCKATATNRRVLHGNGCQQYLQPIDPTFNV